MTGNSEGIESPPVCRQYEQVVRMASSRFLLGGSVALSAQILAVLQPEENVIENDRRDESDGCGLQMKALAHLIRVRMLRTTAMTQRSHIIAVKNPTTHT